MSERGRGFRGDGLVKGYDEMNAEQRLCFNVGYMAAERDTNAGLDALRAPVETVAQTLRRRRIDDLAAWLEDALERPE